MTPSEKIRVFATHLEARGIVIDNIVDSKTDFGSSSYLYIEKDTLNIKVRASDHSVTSVYRVLNEYHINNVGNWIWESHLNEIERRVFPERFIEERNMVFGDAKDFPVDKLGNLKREYIIVKENYFISKKGRLFHQIRERNKEEVVYNRI